jgi:hypothetical protein
MPEEFVEDIIKEEVVEEKTDKEDEEIQLDDKEQDDEENTNEDDDKESSVDDQKNDSSHEKIEKLAEQLGWNKDHQGPEKVDAATYILRSREIQDTMKGHNKDLKNQVNSLQESIKALQAHNENVYKAEIGRLEGQLNKLKKEKREAVELADVDKVDEIDNAIEDIQKNLNLSKVKGSEQVSTESSEIYDEWIEHNEWYEQDDDMAQYADFVAQQYEGAPIKRIYAIVRQKVEEVFPEKFEKPEDKKLENDLESEKPKDKKPIGPKSPVERGNNRDKKASFTVDDLTASQRSTMQQFVKMGIMTEKQYIADIAKMQED